jgi:ring-1,2-phenylacetyl-CoA epoxidase subunit PaaD
MVTAQAWEWLDSVPDPELPSVTITDLGIVRDIREDGDALIVALTPTYSGCPATAVIEEDVTRALHAHGVRNVRIERRLAPAWTTDWITPRGRARLHEHGIAPPAADIGEGIVILSNSTCHPEVRAERASKGEGPIRCPHCGSDNTSEISHFGSTPCKALYRCEACREPFDYVKPH